MGGGGFEGATLHNHSVPTWINADAMHAAPMRLDYALLNAPLASRCAATMRALRMRISPVARTVCERGKPGVGAAALATDGTRAVVGSEGDGEGDGDGEAACGEGEGSSHGSHCGAGAAVVECLMGACSAPQGSSDTVSML